jgi:hypothetical protein
MPYSHVTYNLLVYLDTLSVRWAPQLTYGCARQVYSLALPNTVDLQVCQPIPDQL